MNRAIFLLHRYFGVALGLLLLVWCLSGIVMMYVQFPELTEEEAILGLDQLELSMCCKLPPIDELEAYGSADAIRIEMLADRPVLRFIQGLRIDYIDLNSGEWLDSISSSDADMIAASFARNNDINSFELDWFDERDQWTVYGAFNRHRPLFKFSADDAAATQWYVSSQSGEVVQKSIRRERFWSWLGAVPHWLYPTILRQHTRVWSQSVIWLTILGTFLVTLGLYVGVRQFRSRRNGRLSPYRGAALWHHYAGLFFGILTLTWLISGFFSMNPWGALESRSFAAELARQNGANSRISPEFYSLILSLGSQPRIRNAVRLEAATIHGERYFLAWDNLGKQTRLSSDLTDVEPLSLSLFDETATILRPNVAVADAQWLHKGDDYYYSHHEKRQFPVYRIRYVDGENYYLDRNTGEIVYAVDANRRLYRWLHFGLHRGDFNFIRSRPVWDLVMLIFMTGVTIGALTGTWMGLKRIRRSLKRAVVTPHRLPRSAGPQ